MQSHKIIPLKKTFFQVQVRELIFRVTVLQNKVGTKDFSSCEFRTENGKFPENSKP